MLRKFIERYGPLHLAVHTTIFLLALVVANSTIQLVLINLR